MSHCNMCHKRGFSKIDMNNREQFEIIHTKLFAYRLPFKDCLQFKEHRLNYREGLILQLTDQHAEQHFAEISPLPGFSKEGLVQAKNEILRLLNNNMHNLHQHQSSYPCIQFALDSLFTLAPSTKHINALENAHDIPLLQGDTCLIIKNYQELGRPKRVKLKVAKQPIESDIKTFERLTQLNNNIQIRCDANQAWNKQLASQFFSAINVNHLDYIEEPTRDHATNLWLANRYQIQLGLDETLQQGSFCYQHDGCIKALIIKPSLVGGLDKIDQLVSIAEQHSLQVSFSSSFESIVGLSAIKRLMHRYAEPSQDKKLSLFLGIDTLKYFAGSQLIDEQEIQQDCQQLECLWQSK